MKIPPTRVEWKGVLFISIYLDRTPSSISNINNVFYLIHCSSVKIFPSVLAKPHGGLNAKLSKGIDWLALLIRACMVSVFSKSAI
jgi:hypothetical protein